MNPIRVFTGVLAVGSVLMAGGSVARAGELRGGVAKVDITPAQPVTLSGYASRKDLSTGVHDPLSARAVVFEKDGKHLVLVSTDIIGFYGDTCASMRRRILETIGLQPSELFLSAIHTHAAPTLALGGTNRHPHNVEYTQSLGSALVGVVREAMKNLRPVRLGFGSGSSPVGANRRQKVRDREGVETVRLGRNPAVATDREVQVLQVWDRDPDRRLAVLFAYATHSTSLGPKNDLISGDVHGLAEQFVESYLGDSIVAPAFAGASGDIDPWYRVLPEFNTERGWIPEPVLMGTLLGQEVVHISDAMGDFVSTGTVDSVVKTLELPAKRSDEDGSEKSSVPLTITVGCVGEIAFVGLGAEVFNEIGRDIKVNSPFPHTFVITHCNGAAGYLVVPEAYAEGGYEVRTSPFAPEAAGQTLREVMDRLHALRRDP